MLSGLSDALIFAGLFIIILGFLILMLQSPRGQARGGAVLLIGPVPIIAGNDSRLLIILMILAIALILISVIII